MNNEKAGLEAFAVPESTRGALLVSPEATGNRIAVLVALVDSGTSSHWVSIA